MNKEIQKGIEDIISDKGYYFPVEETTKDILAYLDKEGIDLDGELPDEPIVPPDDRLIEFYKKKGYDVCSTCGHERKEPALTGCPEGSHYGAYLPYWPYSPRWPEFTWTPMSMGTTTTVKDADLSTSTASDITYNPNVHFHIH